MDQNPNDPEDDSPICVLSFNANDASGAAGLAADVLAIASVGAHPMGVVTACYFRDSAEISGQYGPGVSRWHGDQTGWTGLYGSSRHRTG